MENKLLILAYISRFFLARDGSPVLDEFAQSCCTWLPTSPIIIHEGCRLSICSRGVDLS